MKTSKTVVTLAVLATMGLAACSNADVSFADFDYQTVYFANQYPVRTLELGEDLFVDTSLDNQHKVKINATMGGVYINTKSRTITFAVDESLCEGFAFANSSIPVTPMPSSYYTLASPNQIVIPSGNIMGGVEVQLTDSFFADPKSLERTYVIPLRMTAVQGADSILQGTPLVENPVRGIDAHWSIKPRDYVLYAVKYVNPWHGNYLRHGVDLITGGEKADTIRHWEYVEDDEVVSVDTGGLKVSTLPLIAKDDDGVNMPYTLTLTFADDGSCSISGQTDTYEVAGSGKFVSKGEKKSMGDIDRDALYLDYNVNFTTKGIRYTTKDTLVLRDRGVAPEYFMVTPIAN